MTYACAFDVTTTPNDWRHSVHYLPLVTTQLNKAVKEQLAKYMFTVHTSDNKSHQPKTTQKLNGQQHRLVSTQILKDMSENMSVFIKHLCLLT